MPAWDMPPLGSIETQLQPHLELVPNLHVPLQHVPPQPQEVQPQLAPVQVSTQRPLPLHAAEDAHELSVGQLVPDARLGPAQTPFPWHAVPNSVVAQTPFDWHVSVPVQELPSSQVIAV